MKELEPVQQYLLLQALQNYANMPMGELASEDVQHLYDLCRDNKLMIKE